MTGTPIRDDHCFCCGSENERGLKLSFSYDGEGAATCGLEVPLWFSGWQDLTHGGLLSMLLDEAMAHACISVRGHAITAEMNVRFHKPVKTGDYITVIGQVEESRSRIVATTGSILDASGEKVATGTARFLLQPVGSGR